MQYLHIYFSDIEGRCALWYYFLQTCLEQLRQRRYRAVLYRIYIEEAKMALFEAVVPSDKVSLYEETAQVLGCPVVSIVESGDWFRPQGIYERGMLLESGSSGVRIELGGKTVPEFCRRHRELHQSSAV